MPNSPAAAVMNAACAAAFLSDLGYPMSKSTLLKLGRAGKGPAGVISWGRLNLYPQDTLLAWAKSRGAQSKSTTETTMT